MPGWTEGSEGSHKVVICAREVGIQTSNVSGWVLIKQGFLDGRQEGKRGICGNQSGHCLCWPEWPCRPRKLSIEHRHHRPWVPVSVLDGPSTHNQSSKLQEQRATLTVAGNTEIHQSLHHRQLWPAGHCHRHRRAWISTSTSSTMKKGQRRRSCQCLAAAAAAAVTTMGSLLQWECRLASRQSCIDDVASRSSKRGQYRYRSEWHG